jgi:Excalibur calcium-binding domain
MGGTTRPEVTLITTDGEAKPEPAPKPTPKPEPQPDPASEPVPEPTPKLQPEPEPDSEPDPAPEPQIADEEDASPEPALSTGGCRFFSQSEFATATLEEKTFIRECDRAAGRIAKSPAPEPQPQASPKGGGRLTCLDFSTEAEASAAIPSNPQLDRDGDGRACETLP